MKLLYTLVILLCTSCVIVALAITKDQRAKPHYCSSDKWMQRDVSHRDTIGSFVVYSWRYPYRIIHKDPKDTVIRWYIDKRYDSVVYVRMCHVYQIQNQQ